MSATLLLYAAASLVQGTLALSPATHAPSRAASEPLVTDRPDFTESTETIAPGRVQLETGYTFTDEDADEEQSIGEVLVRIGMSPKLELRLALNSYLRTDSPSGRSSGVEDSAIGLKLRLRSPERAEATSFALLLSTTLPTGADVNREPHLQPSALVVAAKSLTSSVGVAGGVALSYPSTGGESFAELSGSLSFAFSLSDNVGAYVELFGFVPESAAGNDTHFLNGGFTWLLSNDTQLDLRVGTGLNDEAADFFIGAGLAHRW